MELNQSINNIISSISGEETYKPFNEVVFADRSFRLGDEEGVMLTDTKGEWGYIRYDSDIDGEITPKLTSSPRYGVNFIESDFALVFVTKCKNIQELMIWLILTLSNISHVKLKDYSTHKQVIIEDEMKTESPTNTSVKVGRLRFSIDHKLTGCPETWECEGC
jgi:hypothetical protein